LSFHKRGTHWQLDSIFDAESVIIFGMMPAALLEKIPRRLRCVAAILTAPV